MLVIDCGACVGKFLRNFLDHEIHAFEPLKKNFDYLNKRYPQIHTYRRAVTGKSGETVKLYLHEDPAHRNRTGSMGSSVKAAKTNVDPNFYEEVTSIALSDFIRSLGKRVNLLKIDTEGTEFDIFEDLLESGVIHDIDIIYYEDHRDRHPDMFDLEKAAAIEARLIEAFQGQLKRTTF